MTIETKFNINDLVQHKFQRPLTDKSKHAVAFEIIEVNTICCYTTAQVFYECRPIHAVTKAKMDDKFTTLFEIIDVGPGHAASGQKEYVRYREDEIKPCDESLKKSINNQS